MKVLQIDQENLGILFAEPTTKKFEHFELDPYKSILLFGLTGVGKTTYIQKLAEIIPRLNVYQSTNISLIETHDINKAYVKWYGNGMKPEHPLEYKNNYDLIIDDLGAEPHKVLAYGTEVFATTDLIIERHLKRHNLFTHITTNLDPTALQNRYGDRVFSRLVEMCNFVEIIGKDYRLA
jgi:DNA replication protein DnaC